MKAAYQQMYETLKQRILRREYAVGELLPPEPRLEEEFRVSRTTVRRAIDLLVQDGFITVKQGFGTQVVSRKTVQDLNRLTSIGKALEEKGHKIGVKGCCIETLPADEEQARLLAVPTGTPLICLHRIRTSDGVPVAILENDIVASRVPGLEREESIQHLYEFLEERYGIRYTSSRDVISACNASYEESQLLEVPPKTALITIRRVCSVRRRPVELDLVRIVAGVYEYEVYRESAEEQGQ